MRRTSGSFAAGDVRMQKQKIRKHLNALMNAPGPLRRLDGNVIEDRFEVGECQQGVTKLHNPWLPTRRLRYFRAPSAEMKLRRAAGTGTICAPFFLRRHWERSPK